jgi:hypothetical protein
MTVARLRPSDEKVQQVILLLFRGDGIFMVAQSAVRDI